jgi:hypothetical protein
MTQITSKNYTTKFVDQFSSFEYHIYQTLVFMNASLVVPYVVQGH